MVKKNSKKTEEEEIETGAERDEAERDEKEEERITPENISEEKNEEEEIEKTPEKVWKDRNDEDYLKKYQYKQNCKLGASETNPDIGSKAARMKSHLLAQPKVRIMIPLDMNEDKNSKQSVCLNGYRLDFPKNTYIEVPEQIAMKLSESLQQREEALAFNRIDGHKDKEAQLL